MINSKALSQISAESVQFRYQKALKQINKLMAINRQIKGQSDQIHYEVKLANDKYMQTLQTSQKLEKDNQNLHNNLNSLNMNNQNLQNLCQNLQMKISEMQKLNINVNEQRFQEKERFLEEELNQIRNQNQKLQIVIQQYSDAINKYRVDQEGIKSENIYIKEQNNQLSQIIETLKNEKEDYIQKISSQEASNKKNQIEELRLKLQASDNWNQKITEEYNELKQKIVEMETKEDYLRPKNLNIKQYCDVIGKEFNRKLNKIQKEKKDIDQKYRQIKTKYNEFCTYQAHYKEKITILEIRQKDIKNQLKNNKIKQKE